MKLSQLILNQLYTWWNTFNHISNFFLQHFWRKSVFHPSFNVVLPSLLFYQAQSISSLSE